jgi:hypothetical protein
VAGIRYIAFVDPSGGSQDAMTLAIAHAEGEVMVLDAVREVRPPFSPEAVVSEFAGLLATYGIWSRDMTQPAPDARPMRLSSPFSRAWNDGAPLTMTSPGIG